MRQMVGTIIKQVPDAMLFLLILSGLMIYDVSSAAMNPRIYYLPPENIWYELDPFDTQEISQFSAGAGVLIGRGQTLIINVTTSNQSTLSLVEYAWDSNELHVPITEPVYTSQNSTSHSFSLPPGQRFRIMVVYLTNLASEPLAFEGMAKIVGPDHDQLLGLIILLFLSMLWGSVVFTIRRVNKRQREESINSVSSLSLSVPRISRLRLVWGFFSSMENQIKILFVSVISWLVFQPAKLIQEISGSPLTTHKLIREVDLALHGYVFPGLLFLLLFLAIETSEVIAARKAHQDLPFLFSLPIARQEWIIAGFFWYFLFYGKFLVFTYFFKVALISLQLGIVYPLSSVLSLSLVLMSYLGCFIGLGLLSSIASSQRIPAIIKGLFLSLIFGSIFFGAIGGLGAVEYSPEPLKGAHNETRLWDPITSKEGAFVITKPNLEGLISTLALPIFALLLGLGLAARIIKRTT